MQSHVGDRYYDRNERLDEFLSSLADVAEKSGIPQARAQFLRQLIPSLRSPFLFVVAGEVNSGKSTFLNALFGDDFCNVAPTPTTERIYYFKYGDEARDIVIDDSFVEVFRPVPFLRDFHIVDTPGTNSIAEGHQEITERFIPMADLVIFLFPVTNPWGASTWDFISQIYEGWLKQVVFVVQQTDLRTRQEVDAILEHMRVTSRERLGREFPTFAVSAKQAIAAKTSEHEQIQLLEESGFNALEEHISGIVAGIPSVTRKSTGVLRSARAVMSEVGRRFEAEKDIIARMENCLGDIDAAIAEESERTLGHLEDVTANGLGEFARARLRLTSMFQRGTGFLSSLKGDRKFIASLERELPEAVTHTARNSAAVESRTIEAGLPALFDRLSAKCRDEIGVDVSCGESPDAPAWLDARPQVTENLERKLHGSLVDSESAGRLESAVGRQRLASRTGLALVLLAGLAVILGFVSKSQTLLQASLAVAGVGLPLAIVLVVLKRRAAHQIFHKRMERAEQSFALGLKESHPEILNGYFRRLSARFEPVRNACKARKEHFEPLFGRLEESRSELEPLEAELAGTSGSTERESV